MIENRKLVYANAIDFVPGVAPYATTTVVELVATADGGTRLTVTTDAMHDEGWTRMATMGWQQQIGKLEREVALREAGGRREAMRPPACRGMSPSPMTTPAPTFRDFASQVFAGDLGAATTTLTVLLALPEAEARSAAEHFQSKTSDPTFLPIAMSLRTAVAGTDDAAIATLLSTCFGLEEVAAQKATAALRSRY